MNFGRRLRASSAVSSVSRNNNYPPNWPPENINETNEEVIPEQIYLANDGLLSSLGTQKTEREAEEAEAKRISDTIDRSIELDKCNNHDNLFTRILLLGQIEMAFILT
jgi:hypothetical protein